MRERCAVRSQRRKACTSVQQALIEIFYNDTKKPGNSTFPGFFHALNFLFVFAKSDRKTVVDEESGTMSRPPSLSIRKWLQLRKRNAARSRKERIACIETTCGEKQTANIRSGKRNTSQSEMPEGRNGGQNLTRQVRSTPDPSIMICGS